MSLGWARGGCNASMPGRSPCAGASSHSPSLDPLHCLLTQPCVLCFLPNLSSPLCPSLTKLLAGQRWEKRCWGAAGRGSPAAKAERPTHPPPDFVLLPSQCLAAYRSRAFYSPQLQPRHAPGQLPAAALLARCQQPRPGWGWMLSPGSPQRFSKRRARAAEEGG